MTSKQLPERWWQWVHAEERETIKFIQAGLMEEVDKLVRDLGDKGQAGYIESIARNLVDSSVRFGYEKGWVDAGGSEDDMPGEGYEVPVNF